jgi:hypothetical protein
MLITEGAKKMTRKELEEKILQLVNDSYLLDNSDIQAIAEAISIEAIKE